MTEDEAAVAGCKCCFHSSCITQYVTSIDLDGSKQPGCPVCFKPLTVALQLERKTEEQVNTPPAANASLSRWGAFVNRWRCRL